MFVFSCVYMYKCGVHTFNLVVQLCWYLVSFSLPLFAACSAGIGRTGVFIGADIGMTQLEKEGEVDIMKIVSTMRQDRGGMVQTEQQYIFLHQVRIHCT